MGCEQTGVTLKDAWSMSGVSVAAWRRMVRRASLAAGRALPLKKTK